MKAGNASNVDVLWNDYCAAGLVGGQLNQRCFEMNEFKNKLKSKNRKTFAGSVNMLCIPASNIK
jgi:hypothetical protein